MIKAVTYTDAGREIVRHYSDRGMFILQDQTGTLYEDARDIAPCQYTYTETDTPIDPDEIEPVEALRIISEGVAS